MTSNLSCGPYSVVDVSDGQVTHLLILPWLGKCKSYKSEIERVMTLDDAPMIPY